MASVSMHLINSQLTNVQFPKKKNNCSCFLLIKSLPKEMQDFPSSI